MESTYIHITQKDGYQTTLFCYETPKTEILGNVLILHGMAEHHGRYLDFIQTLTAEGFDVYAYDHRGHGTDKKLSDLGFLAKKNGASLVVEDALTVCHFIKEQGRSSKLAIFGHSMGSLILRCLLQIYDEPDCAVICSSTMPPVAVSSVGICLANLFCLFRGVKKKSPFLEKVLFGGKPYTSLCTRTTYDWLTRNNTAVGRYIDDPYCGFTCTTSFYRDLTKLAKRAAHKKHITKMRRNLPLLLLTGDKDPVGGYASQIIRLQHTYQNLGFTNTSLIIYSEARHELLNELNAQEVTTDILTFFQNILNSSDQ